jgi:hypothetical protein
VRGITKALRDCVDRTVEEVLDVMFRTSQEFTGGTRRHDDTSVVLVECAK